MTMATDNKAPRIHDWPTRMDAALKAESDIPFNYGSSDCSMFAANIIKAIRGVDIFERWRGKYRTKGGAFRIAKGDPGTVVDKIAGEFGLVEILSPYAQRGDLVLIRNNDELSLGIIWLDPSFIVGKPKTEKPPHIILVCCDDTNIVRAWRV